MGTTRSSQPRACSGPPPWRSLRSPRPDGSTSRSRTDLRILVDVDDARLLAHDAARDVDVLVRRGIRDDLPFLTEQPELGAGLAVLERQLPRRLDLLDDRRRIDDPHRHVRLGELRVELIVIVAGPRLHRRIRPLDAEILELAHGPELGRPDVVAVLEQAALWIRAVDPFIA